MLGHKIAALAILASSVVAQNLPACANTCVGGKNYGGCQQFDVACICQQADWIAGLACCVAQTCSPSDQEDTIKFADKICAGAGITTLPQSATCASSVSTYTSGSGTNTVSVIASASTSAGSTSATATTTASTGASAAAASTAKSTGGAQASMISGAGVGAMIAGLAMAL